MLEALGLPPAGLGPAQAGVLASLSMQPAPEPAEVIWRNTYLTPHDRWWRPVVAAVLLAVVMFVAALPTVATAALANLAPLGTVVGFLEPVLSWAGLSRGVLQTLLPALIIQIIIALLGTILTGESQWKLGWLWNAGSAAGRRAEPLHHHGTPSSRRSRSRSSSRTASLLPPSRS